MGDFYETYGEDAVKSSKILGITLTRHGKGASQTELAGFPHHALDTYLPRLVRAGFRVAICEQLEDPKLTKTLVKRGIVELVTPGVSINDKVLEAYNQALQESESNGFTEMEDDGDLPFDEDEDEFEGFSQSM